MSNHKCDPVQAQRDFLSECEEERKDRNMSKKELCFRSEVAMSTYHKLLDNQKNVSVVTLHKLAEGLDMKLVVCLMEKN